MLRNIDQTHDTHGSAYTFASPAAIYTRKDVMRRTGVSQTTLYELVKRGQFPAASVRLSPRFVRWRAADVEEWLKDPAAWIAANSAESA